jgi:hypothetical protein
MAVMVAGPKTESKIRNFFQKPGQKKRRLEKIVGILKIGVFMMVSSVGG